MLSKLACIGTKLMKLKLAKMDLNNACIVKLLIDVIAYNKNMIMIELSACNFSPK